MIMEATNNIYNTNINNNGSIIIQDNNISIYSLYHIKELAVRSLEIEKKYKDRELQRLIEKNGPKNVQAQQYDSVHASSRVDNPMADFKEIKVLVDDINFLKEELKRAVKERDEVKTTLKEIYDMQPKNIYLAVFVEHHINNVSLKTLSRKLFHTNEFGLKKYYHYDYIKAINSKLIRKIVEEEKNI